MPEMEDTGDLGPWSGCDDYDSSDEDELDEDVEFHRCAYKSRRDPYQDYSNSEDDEDQEEESKEEADEGQAAKVGCTALGASSAAGRPFWANPMCGGPSSAGPR